MAALDRVREEVAYLKIWQGIAVVSGVTIGAWLISPPESASQLTFTLALGGVLLLGLFILILHRQIELRIRSMERL